MRPRRNTRLRPLRTHPLVTAVTATVALICSLLLSPAAVAAPTVARQEVVKTAAVVGFNAENIINDALFYDGLSMTSAEIQTFLDSKIGTCQNGRCLNVLIITADSKAAYYSQTTGNLVCGALTGGTMRASEYIYRVQVACGISAKVILVTMQKEQGLATDKAPTETELRRAMGHLCSDTAPCESAAAGVANQIFGGTEQLKKYKATAFGKQPGRNYVGYSPTASCGGTYLNIRNYATAALYNYTPYQPNAASLAAGYGYGDTCSSYGNRNFYNYYTQWFGSTQAAVDPCKVPDASVTEVAAGEYTTTTSLNARLAPTTACANVAATLPTGTIVTREATFGAWWKVRKDGARYWVHSDYLTATPPVAWKTDRLAGKDRFETAVAVSKATYPAGTTTVYLASGSDFPDALAAAAGAAKNGGSLLLTMPGNLPGVVADELNRLAPNRVVVVGGESVVSSRVRDQVAALRPGIEIVRVGGADRYETSRLLANTFGASTIAYLATGLDFPDALSASAVAGAKGAPVLLVDGTQPSASSDTIAALKALGVTTVVAAGGPTIVSDGILQSLTAAGIGSTRYGGANRYETARLMNQAAYPGASSSALIATGSDFPDALTGAVLAGRTKTPLFSQPAACMTDAVKDRLISQVATRVTLIGGEGVLTPSLASAVRC